MALPRFELTIDADTLSETAQAAGARWRIESESDDGYSSSAATVVADGDTSGELSLAGRAIARIPASTDESRYLLQIPDLGVSAPFRMPAANAVASVLIETYRRQADAIPATGLQPPEPGPTPGTDGVHTDATLDGDGTEGHPLAVAHPFTVADGQAIAAAAGSAAAAEASAGRAVAAAAQEAQDRAAADTALGERIDGEAQARAEAVTAEAEAREEADTALDQRVDTAAAKLVDIHVTEREAWVTADPTLVAFADVTGSRQARDRIVAGDLPLNLVWQATQEFNDQGRAETSVMVVIRVARQATVRRADYRLRLGGADAATLRLDSVHFGLFHSDAQYGYWVFGSQHQPQPFGNVAPDTTFVMQHHGTESHTSYEGALPALDTALVDINDRFGEFDSRLSDDEDELTSRSHIEKGNGAPDANTPGSRPNDFYWDLDNGKLYQYSLLARGFVEILDLVTDAELTSALANLPEPTSEDATARAAAAAALLEAMTVIEIGPDIVHNVAGPIVLGVSIRHPLNAYRTANTMSVNVGGQTPVLVDYDRAHAQQDTLVEVSANSLRNLWALTHEIPDGQGGTRRVQTYSVGSYIPVAVRLQVGRGGDVIFDRIEEVLVVAAPPSAEDDTARMAAAAAGRAAAAAQATANLRTTTAQVDARISSALNAETVPFAFFGAISIRGGSTGLRNNAAIPIPAGSGGAVALFTASARALPTGVLYDAATGTVTLPVGLWRINADCGYALNLNNGSGIVEQVVEIVDGASTLAWDVADTFANTATDGRDIDRVMSNSTFVSVSAGTVTVKIRALRVSGNFSTASIARGRLQISREGNVA